MSNLNALNVNAQKQNVTYHGRHTDGRFRLLIDGKRALGCGIVYRLIERKGKTIRRKRDTSPGNCSQLNDSVSLKVREAGSQALLRFIGVVEYIGPAATSISTIHSDSTANAGISPDVHEGLIVCKGDAAKVPTENGKPELPPNPAKQRVKIEKFEREMALINAQVSQGIDPNISIFAASTLLQRSPASIYRDIESKRLPHPHKVGRRSFFQLSVINQFRLGRLNSQPTSM